MTSNASAREENGEPIALPIILHNTESTFQRTEIEKRIVDDIERKLILKPSVTCQYYDGKSDQIGPIIYKIQSL